MDGMYYGHTAMNEAEYVYNNEEDYDRDDRDWHRDRRHRSRSPLNRGNIRRDRSRSRERDRYSDRYDNDSPFRGEREDHRRRELSNRSIPSLTTSIEYHHGLPEEKPRPSLSDSRSFRNERWQREMPSSTIFLGGVPRFIEEPDIRAELEEAGIVFSDVRMVRNKETGANRGFAFVEFHSIDDARRWMDLNQGLLKVRDAYGVPHTVTMDYSKSGNPAGRSPAPAATINYRAPPLMKLRPPEITEWRINDWKCSRCGCDNFRRRENCFQCNIPRSEGEVSMSRDDDGYDQVGSNPCNTLLLRGLDALTTEASILNSLSTVGDIEPKNLCVVHNPLTGLSRGYAVVEFTSIRDSTIILESIRNMDSPFEVDGKAIIVSYAKNTYNTLMTVVNRQERVMRDSKGNYPPHVGPTSRPGPLRRVADPTNAAEVAEAALLASRLQQLENGDGVIAEASQTSVQTNAVIAPDVNSFVFDESSGYYYDANTGYYYDANTQYFYNPQTSQFMYWDSTAQSYLPAPTNVEAADNSSSTTTHVAGDATTSTATTATVAEQQIDKQKAERAKQAKKIVKDMERWAKVQNAQKESSSGFKKPVAPAPAMTKKEAATADAGFAAISKANKSEKFTIELTKNREEGRPFGKVADEFKSKGKATQLVASYGGDSESEEEAEEAPASQSTPGGKKEELNSAAIEAKMTDWEKLTCLLCKRLFSTKDTLIRHQQMSDLHKSNLEELRKSMSSSKRR